MGVIWYFLLALFFLVVIILAVPSDGAMLASGPSFLVSPKALRVNP